jgi:RNA polymerase sigma factor (sigma-70 family)
MRTEDGSIIHRCLSGDSGAFAILVDKYKAGIYAYTYYKLCNFQDAEDATQEVFERAYRNLRSLRRWESFAFWLYRIAANQCRRWFNARSRRPDGQYIEDQGPNFLDKPSLDAYRDSQVDERLQEALDSLSDTYREVLMLHYFGGMTIKDIARAVGVSPTAVGVRLSRARAQLKEEMIAMMDTAFEGHKLQASFTFRIMEAVKRIKINPMPRATGLPWGLSLAAGIAVVVMTLGSQMAIHQSPELTAFPGETQTLKAREMSVDILKAPGTSLTAGRQGDTDGVAMDWRSPEINSLLAPAKGGGTWTQKADMTTARQGLSTSVVDERIYAFGGSPDEADTMLSTVEEYDPATDRWTKKADMLKQRYGHSSCAVNGKSYAIGGRNNVDGLLSTVEEYDPVTDKWTRKADIPTPRYFLSTGPVSGKIYAIGGGVGDHGPFLSTVEVYDPVTDKWTKKADMPTARAASSAAVVNGKIYVIGGTHQRHAGSDYTGLSVVEEYDPVTDKWTKKADMPTARFALATSVVSGRIYAIGGRDRSPYFSTVEEYDPATDTWTKKADMPTARAVLSASAVNGKIYAIGGAKWPTFYSAVEEYTPEGLGQATPVSPTGKLPTKWGEQRTESVIHSIGFLD